MIWQDMFAAATNTTYTTLVWAMAELINQPAEMRKLQDEIRAAVVNNGGGSHVNEDHLAKLQYLRPVIKETLRLHSPLPLLLPRETLEDTELLGYRVPARTRVVINAWAIGRDPRYWDAAEEFLPERFEDGAVDFTGSSYEFLPFGAGRRMCPGFNYGLASMELALVALLYHFDWSLPEGVAEVDMEEAPGLGVRRLMPLVLLATPFVPVVA
jgi:cytochrome P450